MTNLLRTPICKGDIKSMKGPYPERFFASVDKACERHEDMT